MEYDPCDISPEWSKSFEALLSFNRQMFNYVPARIKGKISVILDDYKTKFENVIERYGDHFNDADIVVVDNHDFFKTITKSFNIHEGLEFRFQLTFSFNPEEDDEE